MEYSSRLSSPLHTEGQIEIEAEASLLNCNTQGDVLAGKQTKVDHATLFAARSAAVRQAPSSIRPFKGLEGHREDIITTRSDSLQSASIFS